MNIEKFEDLHPDDQQYVTALDDISRLAFDYEGRLVLTKSGKPKKRAGRPSKQELEATFLDADMSDPMSMADAIYKKVQHTDAFVW